MRSPSVLPALALILATGCGPGATQSSATPQSPAEPATSSVSTPTPTAAVGRGPVMARVNGSPIFKADFDGAMEAFLKNNGVTGELSEERRQEANKIVLDGLIGSELLFQKARSIPIEVPQTDVDQRLEQARAAMGEAAFQGEMTRRGMKLEDLAGSVRQNMMVQKMIDETIVAPIKVTDQEIQTFYDEHPKEMEKPETVEASHILVRSVASDPEDKKAAARRKIDDALSRIKAGADFAQVAREVSEDGSAAQGGALGNVPRGRTVPTFEAAAFQLPVGQVSEVVQTTFGFHVIKVTAKNPASKTPMAEVKDRIAEFIKRRRTQEEVEKLVTSLRQSAKVEIL